MPEDAQLQLQLQSQSKTKTKAKANQEQKPFPSGWEPSLLTSVFFQKLMHEGLNKSIPRTRAHCEVGIATSPASEFEVLTFRVALMSLRLIEGDEGRGGHPPTRGIPYGVAPSVLGFKDQLTLLFRVRRTVALSLSGKAQKIVPPGFHHLG